MKFIKTLNEFIYNNDISNEYRKENGLIKSPFGNSYGMVSDDGKWQMGLVKLIQMIQFGRLTPVIYYGKSTGDILSNWSEITQNCLGFISWKVFDIKLQIIRREPEFMPDVWPLVDIGLQTLRKCATLSLDEKEACVNEAERQIKGMAEAIIDKYIVPLQREQ